MFTQKISMDCTRYQYEKHLKDELLKMGYDDSHVTFGENEAIIVNNWAGKNGLLVSLIIPNKDLYNRHYLGSFNPELFLALAAMTDGERVFGYREWRKQKIGDKWALGEVGENCNPYWRKATKEEIMERFGNNKEPMWKSYSNTTKNLEEIYTAIELLKSKGVS